MKNSKSQKPKQGKKAASNISKTPSVKIHAKIPAEGRVKSLGWLLDVLIFLILFIGPQVFLTKHYDFANLPQLAFIHILSTLMLAFVLFYFGRLTWSLYYIPIFGFLIWALISISWGHNNYEGISTINLWLGPVTLFFALANSPADSNRITRILDFIFASAVVSAIIGCLQYLTKFPFVPQVVEPAATFANKNMAAHIMVLSIPLGIGLLFSTKSNWKSFFYAIGTALLLAFLYYTKTKAAWLAFLVEAVLFGFALLILRQKFPWSMAKQISSLLAILVLGLLLNLSPYGWSPAFKEISSKVQLVKGAVEGEEEKEEAAYGSVGLRFAIWRNTLEMIKDRPILGFGLGNHKVFYPIYHRKAVVEKVFSEEAQLHNVHNDYLQLFSETGAIGFLFLCFLFILWTLSTIRLAKATKHEHSALYPVSIYIAIIGIMVNAFFCFPSFRAVPPTIVMAFTAVLFLLEQKHGISTIKFIQLSKTKRIASALVFFVLAGFLSVYYSNLLTSDRYYLMLSSFEKKRNWTGIIDIAKKELELEPHRAKIRSYLGRAYIESGKCKEGAEELKKVIAYYPYHMNALLNLGVAYSCTGEYEKAIESYKKVLEIKPDYAKVHNNIGHVYLKLGQTEKGLEAFKEAEKYSPSDPSIILNIGTFYLNSGDVDNALQYLQKAISLDPRSAIAYKQLASVYLRKNQKEKAKEALEKALSLDPNLPGANRVKEVLELIKKDMIVEESNATN